MRGAGTRMPRLAVLAFAAVLLVTGCAGAAGEAAPAASASAVSAPTGPLAADGLQDPRPQQSSTAPASDAVPTRLVIPSIGVDSALEDLAIDADGRLSAPVDYDLAGWYSGGVVPGAVGPAILAGHIDSLTSPAVFARLAELTPGAEVRIVMSDGAERVFHVSGSAQSAKSEFPTAEVYSNVPAPELRLITCAGRFDTTIGHYDDNLIVFATLG